MTEDKTMIEQTDQITKQPESVVKIKNPKRVAAGIRLAAYHKKAKNDLKKEKLKVDTIDVGDDVEENNTTKTSWMPEMSLTTGLTLVGITLTGIDLYMRYKSSEKPKIHQPIREIEHEDPPARISIKATKSNKLIGME